VTGQSADADEVLAVVVLPCQRLELLAIHRNVSMPRKHDLDVLTELRQLFEGQAWVLVEA